MASELDSLLNFDPTTPDGGGAASVGADGEAPLTRSQDDGGSGRDGASTVTRVPTSSEAVPGSNLHAENLLPAFQAVATKKCNGCGFTDQQPTPLCGSQSRQWSGADTQWCRWCFELAFLYYIPSKCPGLQELDDWMNADPQNRRAFNSVLTALLTLQLDRIRQCTFSA